ncbi:hypothetical protein SLEP1_g57286 [Rubroshorea leprosula]|uniref:Uncharacterized protein n=1 Tax=Rubroshorea leprosula TaxID=152421 RepID=A0AAV5MP17_9ROSI|nr:hypothetical protein SLEP1_g57286 [Rubroshorea leprosula]
MGVLGESLPTVLLECHAPCTHSLSFGIRSMFEVNPTSTLESLRIWLGRAILPALRSKIGSR